MTTYKNVGDIMNLLHKMSVSKNDKLRKDAEGLFGPRSRGSTTKYGLDHLESSHPIREAHADERRYAKGVDVYVIMAPTLEGKCGAITLDEALKCGWPVAARLGEHGPELYVDGRTKPSRLRHAKLCTGGWIGDMLDEDRIFVLIGPHKAMPEVIYTWHPGEPLPYLDAMTAVKTHDG